MPDQFHIRHTWFFAIFLFCAALVLANVVHYVLFRIARRKEAEDRSGILWGLQRHLGRPARAIFFLTCIRIVQPFIPGIPDNLQDRINQIILMIMIVLFGWFAICCIYALQAAILRKYDLSGSNNIQARRVHTQFQLFRRVLISFVVVIDAGALLWSFNDPRIWHYGSGLLASAGIASLIIATAAKSTAANFFAGLQIAFTEPIRIDDVVVVQGEWGRIEEINSAYVIVKCWDLRRLVVPLNYFIENSFQNWTRESSDLMGTAFLHVDYSIPVEVLRQHLSEIVHASPLWDGKTCSLQVTDLTERTMELRCLVSSATSSQLFDLRCIVREQMTAFIQQTYPKSFPVTRGVTVADHPANPLPPGSMDI